jgi:uncharacterized DUF497 family protein
MSYSSPICAHGVAYDLARGRGSHQRRILYIVSTESGHRIRIISARDATRHERRLYEEAE